MFEDNFITGSRGQTQQQLQEEIDLQALEDQERTIRELEVIRVPHSRTIQCLTYFVLLLSCL